MSELQAEEVAVVTEDVDLSTKQGVAQVIGESDVITIGDEPPPPEDVEPIQAPAWVKELRKNHKELQRKNRELEEKLKVSKPAAAVVPELGAKPKLEDNDYDADKFEEALSNWYDRKRLADEQTSKAKERQTAEDSAWQNTLKAYGDAKSGLKVPDYEEAEITAQGLLSETQQGIILKGAENPALVVYALGKNPAKAKELAAINDPVKYAFEVAKLETQLKVTKRHAPPPEGSVTKGSAAISGSVDSTLERLRADAAKTGNYTKVMQYRAAKRQT